MAFSLRLHPEIFVGFKLPTFAVRDMVLIYAELQDYPMSWLLHQVLGSPKHKGEAGGTAEETEEGQGVTRACAVPNSPVLIQS